MHVTETRQKTRETRDMTNLKQTLMQVIEIETARYNRISDESDTIAEHIDDMREKIFKHETVDNKEWHKAFDDLQKGWTQREESARFIGILESVLRGSTPDIIYKTYNK
jgi:hypothetical protein